jgi:GyrI-like small molecule binding protein
VPGDCRIVTVERRLTAVVKVDVPMPEIPQAERAARAALAAAKPWLVAGVLGDAFTLWRRPAGGRMSMEPGVTVSRPFDPTGTVVPSELPDGRAAHLLLVGPYAGIPAGWQRLFAWCAAEQLALAGINWQVYEGGDKDTATARTALYALLV